LFISPSYLIVPFVVERLVSEWLSIYHVKSDRPIIKSSKYLAPTEVTALDCVLCFPIQDLVSRESFYMGQFSFCFIRPRFCRAQECEKCSRWNFVEQFFLEKPHFHFICSYGTDSRKESSKSTLYSARGGYGRL